VHPTWETYWECIAVEYLLAQTNRDDLLTSQQMPEIPSQVLEEDKDEPDTTVCMPVWCVTWAEVVLGRLVRLEATAMAEQQRLAATQ
ncbi:hypothetical protein JOB18_016055, partial [Solea senegalensis]